MRFLASLLLVVSAAAHAELPKNASAWGAKTKASVQASLKDPPAARFKNVFVSSWEWKGEKHPSLCGEVNAKNSYGGYIGNQRFYSPGDGSITYETEHPTVFQGLWDEHCAAKLATVK